MIEMTKPTVLAPQTDLEAARQPSDSAEASASVSSALEPLQVNGQLRSRLTVGETSTPEPSESAEPNLFRTLRC
jgi:hypothetical protein